MENYTDFVVHKSERAVHTDSIILTVDDLNGKLYDFQKDIVRWALAKGRAAIFADCGLGKTAMQLEWAHRVCVHTGGNALIVAPLTVSPQTVGEGLKFGVPVTLCETADDIQPGVNITNYEKLDKFAGVHFSAVVLDESSILKSFTGKVRNQIIDFFSDTPFRLACTATPAPNDFMELGNHAEFLGIMSYSEMLSMFFVHDGGQTSKWRLKGHAEDVFWQWLGSWAVVMNSPADLGYDLPGYDLPPLRVHEVIVDGDAPITESMTLTQRREARRATLAERCQAAADLVNGDPGEQWLVWCDLNSESEALAHGIPDAVEVKGSDRAALKSSRLLGFSMGFNRALVTKPSIAGFGMNWQNCHKMIFVGLSDSYEQYYQAVRRCWRFGQSEPVDVYIVISAREGAVKANIERKQADCDKMRAAMGEQTREIVHKFNAVYGETLTEPEILLPSNHACLRLPGIDGKAKMSKSLGNCIYLSDEPEDIKKKIMSMYTDPGHLRVQDPGKVEGNPVFTYLDAFSRPEHFAEFLPEYQNLDELKAHYQRGGLGDVKIKKFLNAVMQAELEPIRTRRKEWEQRLPEVVEILKEGSAVAEQTAAATLADVRKSMRIDYFTDNNLLK